VLTGSLPAVKMIVKKTGKKCVDQRDGNNRTALILATMGGHGEVVNYLLSVGGRFVLHVLLTGT